MRASSQLHKCLVELGAEPNRGLEADMGTKPEVMKPKLSLNPEAEAEVLTFWKLEAEAKALTFLKPKLLLNYEAEAEAKALAVKAAADIYESFVKI